MPARKNAKPKKLHSLPRPRSINGLHYRPWYKVPDWYKIRGISKHTFIEAIRPLYDIIEGKKPSKSELDPFAFLGWKAARKLSDEQFSIEEKVLQSYRAWTMAWGNFHQTLMGSHNGWENLETGHESKLDIRRTDGTCYGEIKNQINTMNSGGKESVYGKLSKQVKLGRRALLVIVNGTRNERIENPASADFGIEWITGRKFYEELSGRSSFFDDLLTTTEMCFTRFKTHSEMILSFTLK